MSEPLALDLTGLDVPQRPRLLIPTAEPLVIEVLGKPITQGSKVRGRYGNIRDDNADTLHPWRDSVSSAAYLARGNRETLTCFVEVSCWFYFDRPAYHYGTGRNAGILKSNAPAYPTASKTSGDLDKLLRAILDALKVAGIFKDDSLVVRTYAEKLWTGGTGMDLQGARIHVSELR